MSQPYQTIDVVRSIAPHLFDHSRRTYRRRTTKMAVPASVPLQTGSMARELESMSPKARQHYAECAQQRAKLDKFYRGPREEEIRLYEARWVETTACFINWSFDVSIGNAKLRRSGMPGKVTKTRVTRESFK